MPTTKSTAKKADAEVQEPKYTPEQVQDLIKANEEFAEKEKEREHQLAQAEKELSEYKAKSNPVLRANRFEAEDHQVGQDGERHFNDDGEIEQVDTRQLDEAAMKEKAAMLKFMEEPVTVEIHEVSEENADFAFPIWVNGQVEFFARGQQKTVKRKFVEGLARARKTGYRNVLKVDPNTGVQEYVWPSHTGLRYPFSVVEDRNPRGRDWLKATLRQP